MHTGNVYQHWRETTDQKRVLLLTRSAFAGEQRNAAAVWSGDVYTTFNAFARQPVLDNRYWGVRRDTSKDHRPRLSGALRALV